MANALHGRNRHGPGLFDACLREARGCADRLAGCDPCGRPAAQQPPRRALPDGGRPLVGLSGRKPRQGASRRRRWLHGVSRLIPDADHPSRASRRQADRGHCAVQNAVQRALRLRPARPIPARADPARRLGLPLPSDLRPGNERGGSGMLCAGGPHRIAPLAHRPARRPCRGVIFRRSSRFWKRRGRMR